MRQRSNTTLMTVLAMLTCVSALAQPAPRQRALEPVDAFTGILAAFRTHPLVMLGEGPHGNEPGHAFRLALIRDPRFAATVNDIVVECGSGHNQDLMDRFINGGDVPAQELKHVWQDTTITTSACERPIYEEFYRAIRDVNAGLPPGRKLRVLLGDAPIDWRRVHTREDVHRAGVMKGPHAAALVEKEVIAKQRRALIVFGDGWIQGRGTNEQVLINLLDGPPPRKRVFAITTAVGWMPTFIAMQPDLGSWRVPGLAAIKGTALGAKPLATFFQLPPAPGWNTLTMEDEFDAMLYLGPRESLTTAKLPPSLCADPEYVKMRLARLALSVPQAIKGFTDGFRAACNLPPSPP
jgi:hypothetical protein